MSIAQLRAFHLVAAAGGFSQAAREIAVSQSTLSGQVRQLEQGTGTTLFDRQARGVQLTLEGEALYEVTTRLFAAEAEARALLKDESSRIGGHLRVIADGPTHSLPIIQHMHRKRPKLTFSLGIANSERVIAQLIDYRADVGITASVPDDARLHVREIMRNRINAFVSRDHPLAARARIKLSDMEDMPLVMRERGSRTRAVFEENLARTSVNLGTVVEVSTQDGVREAVALGFGMGVCTDIEFGHDQRLHVLPIEDTEVALVEFAVCLEERRKLPLVRDFLEAAAAHATASGRTGPAQEAVG